MPGLPLIPVPDGATCISQLKRFAQEDPHRPAFVLHDANFDKIVLTRQQIWDHSQKFAAFLRHHGIKKGDIVCDTLINSPEKIIVMLGTLVAGACYMHGQILLADGQDLVHNYEVSRCRAVVADPGHVGGPFSVLKRLEDKDEDTGEVVFTGLPCLKVVLEIPVIGKGADFVRGLHQFEQKIGMYEATDVTEEDVAFIFSTSGTTGFSKLVPHSHRSCLKLGQHMSASLGVESGESKCFLDRSLGWIGGFPGPYLVSGCTRTVSDLAKGRPADQALHALKILNDVEADCGLFVPVLLDPVAKLIRAGTPLKKRLRGMASGGTPLTRNILDAIGLITDAICPTYGTTECGFVACFRIDARSEFEDYCAGYPNEGFEIKIVDEEHRELPAGQVGQTAIRGPTKAVGYLNEPEKTKAAHTSDGFFLLGDAGYKNEKGQLFVLGRMADSIKRGTYIHYPGWMEVRIQECPGVEEVAVIGIPDPVYTEVICVCVVPSASAKQNSRLTDEVQAFCDRLLLTSKSEEISATVKYVLLFETLPFNLNGKLDRKALKAEACKRLAVEINDNAPKDLTR